MTGINRTGSQATGSSLPTSHAPSDAPSTSGAHPAPDQGVAGGLRRRTESGHVPGEGRPAPTLAASSLPPRAAAPAGLDIASLAMQQHDVARAIAAVRQRSLPHSVAVAQFPGLSRMIHTDGHWATLGNLKAVANELPTPNAQQGFWDLIGNLNALMAGRAPGQAAITVGQQPAAAMGGSSRPIPPVPRFPAELAIPREPSGPAVHGSSSQPAKLEIPVGLDLNSLGDKWWDSGQAPGAGATANQPIKLEIPVGLDMASLGDKGWDSGQAPGAGATASQPIKLEIPVGLDMASLDDNWWDSGQAPGAGGAPGHAESSAAAEHRAAAQAVPGQAAVTAGRQQPAGTLPDSSGPVAARRGLPEGFTPVVLESSQQAAWSPPAKPGLPEPSHQSGGSGPA